MNEAKRELVQNWLVKACHDLTSARKLVAEPDRLLDTAIYHCQQAAEKAVKGFLVFHDRRFEKTHDVRVLTTLAGEVEPKFLTHHDAAVFLTPFAQEFRYPGNRLEPSLDEFDEALQAAETILQFVLSRLPKELHPPR